MADLPSVVEAINDLITRIERLDPENGLEIGSIVLRLDYITRMLVNLEVPDEIVNTMRGLYESVVQLEANHNVVGGDGYAAPIFCTGTRGRPSYEIPREKLSFLLDQGFKVSQISGMLGVGQRTQCAKREDKAVVFKDRSHWSNAAMEGCSKKTPIQCPMSSGSLAHRWKS